MWYRQSFLFYLTLLLCVPVMGQVYTDYVGAGHNQGVTVMSSSNSNTTEVNTTVDGSGLGIDAYNAARFLSYASLGADYETIQTVADQGISDWLDAQFALPPQVNFQDTTWAIWEHFYPQYIAIWGQDYIVNHG
ncbi:MAG: hypothetical protein AAGH79_09415, partial [Bacteroidota bacterium]